MAHQKKENVVFSWGFVMSLLWIGGWLPTARTSDAANRDNRAASDSAVVSLAELRSRNSQNLEALTTAVIEETVVELRTAAPDDEQRMRVSMIDSKTRQINRLAVDVLSEAASKYLRQQLEEELARVDHAILVSRLNRSTRVQRTTTVDFVTHNARHDDSDLRDTRYLAELYSLHPLDAGMLNLTGSLILKGDHSIQLMPNADNLAFVADHPRFDADKEAYKFGVLPSWVFSDEFDPQVHERIPTVSSEVEIVGSKDDKVRFVATLRADLGYRVTRLRKYSSSGELREETTASDFRQSGRVLMPFHTTLRQYRPGQSEEFFLQEREVRSIRLNADVSDAAFEIPAEYHIQDVRSRP